jgi:hypothetical protein
MGIDLYLRWAGQTPEELAAQEAAWLISNGTVGYLRESFSGGPYATKILAREAFESPTEQAGSCTPLAVRPGIRTAARRTGNDSHRST